MQLVMKWFLSTLQGHENLTSIIACKPTNKKIIGTEVTILIVDSGVTNDLKNWKEGIF